MKPNKVAKPRTKLPAIDGSPKMGSAVKAPKVKGLARLQLYMKARPVFENMGMTASSKNVMKAPSRIWKRPGKKGGFSLGGVVKKNFKYNSKMIPRELGKMASEKTAQRGSGKAKLGGKVGKIEKTENT